VAIVLHHVRGQLVQLTLTVRVSCTPPVQIMNYEYFIVLWHDSKICKIPGIKEICKILENVFNNHIPLVDFDGDHFGIESSLRGTSWRGKDCDDFSKKIRPGAHSVNGDAVIDHNCNGIFGLNPTTNQPWETEFCNDTQRLGIAVLGDSVSAHFHIPEQWLDARQLSVAAFEHLLFIIENGLDWPQLSGVMAFSSASFFRST